CSVAFCLHCFFTPISTSVIYTLSLHDALPISADIAGGIVRPRIRKHQWPPTRPRSTGQRGTAHAATNASYSCARLPSKAIFTHQDRKSTRLNSSHVKISYAVFCSKKKTSTAIS